MQKEKRQEKGNVLFIILIGIVLFAALTFTLTKVTSGTKSISLQDSRLYAQQILTYAEKINNAVQTVMYTNECLDEQLNFVGITGDVTYSNAASPANKKCHLFDKDGGAMTYVAPVTTFLDSAAAAASGLPAGEDLLGNYFVTGNTCVGGIGTGAYTNCTAGNEDLVLILPWVRSEVCEAINQILTGSKTIPEDDTGAFEHAGAFLGSFTSGNNDETRLGSATWTAPGSSGCFYNSAANDPGIGYHFYYVLVAR